jgi:hypothetical protein
MYKQSTSKQAHRQCTLLAAAAHEQTVITVMRHVCQSAAAVEQHTNTNADNVLRSYLLQGDPGRRHGRAQHHHPHLQQAASAPQAPRPVR